MSIAPFQPATAAPPPAQKAEGKSLASGKDGRHAEAGADSGLGFLAELAAASVALAPIVPQAPVATLPTGTTTGDALMGTASGATLAELAATPGAAAMTVGLPAKPGTGPAAVAGGKPAVTAQALATDAVTSAAPALAQAAAQPTPVVTTGVAAKPVGPGTRTSPKTDAALAPQAEAASGTPLADPAATGVGAPATGSHAGLADSAPAPAQPAPVTADAASDAVTATATDALGATAVATLTPVANDQPPAQTTAVLRQVFPEITKAVATGPGTHRIAITLHPDDLGEVRVTVVVRGDTVRVDVATDPMHGVARTALEHGAPELRRLLEATGSDAKVTFREFGTPSTATGSATDGGRGQGFAQAQSQLQAQAEARSQGQGGGSRFASDHSDGSAPSGSTAPASVPDDTSAPTARRASSGVDQLI